MTFRAEADPHDRGGPPGYTYAAALVRVAEDDAQRPCSPAEMRTALRQVRFTGWLSRPEGGWIVAIPADASGTVAAGRRGVVELGEWLAKRLGATVIVFRVFADRQLLIAGWRHGQGIGRYVSDPSSDHPDRADIHQQPLGMEFAPDFAAVCGRPDVAEELTDLLGEELDPGSVIESERLAAVLRLLDLPRWLVAISSLPRDIPTGPRRSDLIRLGAGSEGIRGAVRRRLTEPMRRRRRQPPAVADPPRQIRIDPWLL